jgi:Holliday junction DNA helicase RuvA
MIDYIEGKLINADPEYVIVDTGGWGLKLSISLFTFNELKDQLNKSIKIFTQLIVKEDSIELIGFYNTIERQAFVLLNKVSGVGPKVALSILSILDLATLKSSIQNEDIKTLTTVPGIGKKTAQKIIIELKDSIKNLPVSITKLHTNNFYQEAKEALVNFGFDLSEIQLVLDDCVGDTVEEIVKQALMKLSK